MKHDIKKVIKEANDNAIWWHNRYNAIKKQIENIIDGNFDEKLTKNCSKIMMDLVYKVYITRYKKHLTTNLGTIQFKLYLNIEYLNIYLRKILDHYEKGKISKEEILDLLSLIDLIINYSKNKCKLDDVIYKSKFINEKYKKSSELFNEILLIVTSMVDELKEAKLLGNKEADKIYKEWERTYLDKPKELFKEYFDISSIRFKFAIRMAITLTFSIFVAEFLGYYKTIWAIITIMSIMQPYYEDTISKTRERIKGNIIAILFTGIVIHLFNSKLITILILVISLYLLYGFKEYYKISLFAGMASICMSSLSVSLNKLLVYRIFYVIIGVGVVLFANKFIFPYRLKDGIGQLIKKILKYDEYLIDTSRECLNKSKGDNYIRDLIIHITLLTQKLYLRNLQYKDDNLDKFIDKNNEFAVRIGYKILIVYKKRYNENIFKYISELYYDFYKSIRNSVKEYNI